MLGVSGPLHAPALWFVPPDLPILGGQPVLGVPVFLHGPGCMSLPSSLSYPHCMALPSSLPCWKLE